MTKEEKQGLMKSAVDGMHTALDVSRGRDALEVLEFYRLIQQHPVTEDAERGAPARATYSGPLPHVDGCCLLGAHEVPTMCMPPTPAETKPAHLCPHGNVGCGTTRVCVVCESANIARQAVPHLRMSPETKAAWEALANDYVAERMGLNSSARGWPAAHLPRDPTGDIVRDSEEASRLLHGLGTSATSTTERAAIAAVGVLLSSVLRGGLQAQAERNRLAKEPKAMLLDGPKPTPAQVAHIRNEALQEAQSAIARLPEFKHMCTTAQKLAMQGAISDLKTEAQ